MKKLDFNQKGEQALVKRAALFFLLAWLPLMIITIIDGTFSGKDLITLVSDRLTAGSYSYKWSRPAGIASGVYLYRLSVGSLTTKSGHYMAGEAGEFVETMKMVLMR